MSKLAVSIVQFNITWKEKLTNFERIEEMLHGIDSELVVLPELFQTGFCTDDMSLAESMEGDTVSWMCTYSKKYKNAVCGSFLCQEKDQVFNRFV
ncbi:MAG: nitrilase-related carbon-nitrogen hydrolase, partial [Bacteroidia bacterium]